MRHLCSRKIRPWLPHNKLKGKSRKGTMTLFSVFLFFVFSTLGLGMLHLTQIYLKLSAYKKNSMILGYASENGIKQSFHHLIGLLFQNSSLGGLSPEEISVLKEDAVNKGTAAVEMLLGKSLPLIQSETWENLNWSSQTRFFLNKMEDLTDFFQAAYLTEIRSEGMLLNFGRKKESSLEGTLEILAGYIPLPALGVFIDKKLSADQKENFQAANKIIFIPSDENQITQKINFSDGGVLPQESNALISKAIKINIFNPEDLSISVLRKALGLEEIDEPVPDGVYLIQDDLGLGGIYVQGNLQEMVLAIEGNYQVISFVSDQGQWILKFSPSLGKTTFLTPEGSAFYDLVPLGIIMVNGSINSLGGGIVDPGGRVLLVKDEEVPSILAGANLTIISSDRMTVSSHLIYQGVKWQEGIPYIKDSKSQLVLYATGKGFTDSNERDGQIVIANDSPENLKIHASLTAGNKGFLIEGEKKNVQILGNLITSDYTSNGNTLEIKRNEQILEDKSLLQNAPKTAKSVLFPSRFKIMAWKEN